MIEQKRPPRPRNANTARPNPKPGPGRPRAAVDVYQLERQLREGRSQMEIAKTLGISSGTVRRTIARMRNEHGDDWGRHDPAMAPPKPTVSADVHDTPEQLAALARETLAWAMIYGRERDLSAAVRAAVFVSQQAESRDPAIDTLVTDDALDQLRLAIERASPGTPRLVDDDEGLTAARGDRIQ